MKRSFCILGYDASCSDGFDTHLETLDRYEDIGLVFEYVWVLSCVVKCGFGFNTSSWEFSEGQIWT